MSIAPKIRSACKKSVQQTALKPPKKVIAMMMNAAKYIAKLASRPVTVLNKVPQALMLEAE